MKKHEKVRKRFLEEIRGMFPGKPTTDCMTQFQVKTVNIS